MAACALDAQAEKELRNVFDLLIRLINFAIPDDRRIGVGGSRGGQNFAHEAVVRFVFI